MLNRIILCLGSNFDSRGNMESAGVLLRNYFDFIRFSDAVYTEAIGMGNNLPFLNQVAVAHTPDEPEQIVAAFKQMEKQLGRTPDQKAKGCVPIDIDLLQWNDQILKPVDMQREYVSLGIRMLTGT